MQILAGVGGGAFDISGGQETVTVGGFKYCVFTSSGTLTITMPGNVSLCTVGGGGGSGFDIPGGGGGGELDLFASFAVTSNLTVTVGAGGAFSATANDKGSNGGTSSVVEGVTTHQSALGGGGSGSGNNAVGGAGGSGGGGAYSTSAAGGAASGSNTFAGGQGRGSTPSAGGGGGGATAVGGTNPSFIGGEGYALTSIDTNLTAANFSTTLTGKTYVSSGGGGSYYMSANTGDPQAGGTNAGTGSYDSSIRHILATSPTSYGCGGGGGGGFGGNGTAGFAGIVIARIPA